MIKRNSQLPAQIKLGVTAITFENQLSTDLWATEIQPLLTEIEQQDDLETIRENPRIQATKQAYKALGKDPARFRPSSDSLWRRVAKGKGLYQVNPLVDLNNYLSLQFKVPLGSYDQAALQAPVQLTKGAVGATYPGIGKKAINLDNLLVLADVKGPFGSPTADSTRAMITEQTTSALVVVYGFGLTEAELQQCQTDVATAVTTYLKAATVEKQFTI
jgi:DNA/RNA-binding domain of Phe-tRNA-synthetase-like protein